MTDIHTPHTKVPSDGLAKQLLQHFTHGGTLGELTDISERQYEVMYTVGHAFYAQGRFAEASTVFCFLVLQKPNEHRFVKAHAAALQMTQDYASAIRLYTLAAMMDITDLSPCFHTCECLIALGLKKEAADALSIIVHQCMGETHAELRQRAQGLLDLLAQPAASAAAKAKKGTK